RPRRPSEDDLLRVVTVEEAVANRAHGAKLIERRAIGEDVAPRVLLEQQDELHEMERVDDPILDEIVVEIYQSHIDPSRAEPIEDSALRGHHRVLLLTRAQAKHLLATHTLITFV